MQEVKNGFKKENFNNCFGSDYYFGYRRLFFFRGQLQQICQLGSGREKFVGAGGKSAPAAF
jgi:hypothetical protein